MNTYFASPEKTLEVELTDEIKFVGDNPVMSGLLHSVGGLLAVLDKNRQVVALNGSFLKILGIDDPESALGLRLGEVLDCVHANDKPAGCGTTKFCSTCGAAIAMVSCQKENKPMERICSLQVKRSGKDVDLSLLVRAHPIELEDYKFLLLFLQDITHQQQIASLEKVFFHDIKNILNSLIGAGELLNRYEPSELSEIILRSSWRLHKEIEMQRCLSMNDTSKYQLVIKEYSMAQIMGELIKFFKTHPVAKDKTIEYPDSYPQVAVKTDLFLLLRVLCNMLTNALEATTCDKPVSLRVEKNNDRIEFMVNNAQVISDEISLRIFQRNFSTKDGDGRGLGTYSMKLFGEEFLKGEVRFTTNTEHGTTFIFSCPF